MDREARRKAKKPRAKGELKKVVEADHRETRASNYCTTQSIQIRTARPSEAEGRDLQVPVNKVWTSGSNIVRELHHQGDPTNQKVLEKSELGFGGGRHTRKKR